jgi:lipoate-protein ligase A
VPRLKKRLLEVIEKFRQKGAISPDKAMTIEELGLPPKFKETMERRLGRSGVFVEVNGKYYLSEERLKEIKERLAERRGFRRW